MVLRHLVEGVKDSVTSGPGVRSRPHGFPFRPGRQGPGIGPVPEDPPDEIPSGRGSVARRGGRVVVVGGPVPFGPGIGRGPVDLLVFDGSWGGRAVDGHVDSSSSCVRVDQDVELEGIGFVRRDREGEPVDVGKGCPNRSVIGGHENGQWGGFVAHTIHQAELRLTRVMEA